MTGPHPVERVLALGTRRLFQWGIPLAIVALAFPAPGADEGLLAYTLTHLAIIQVITFIFTIEISTLSDTPWFTHLRRPWLASSASLIAAVVGFSALLTLATSAAARYDVSLQFLQLLSSLDIAWVVAAIYLGSRRLWGGRIGFAVGLALVAVCVWSIALYLQVVGFTDAGGWLVHGAQMLRIVLPADTLAAVISLSVFISAARSAQPTEQARPQS